MTDKTDDHYQPWLRHGDLEGGIARPPSLPTSPAATRMRASRAKAPEPATIPAEPDPAAYHKPTTVPLGARLGATLGAFADWTIRLGAAADIPSRIAALNLDRRARSTAAAAVRIAGAAGSTSLRGARTLAAITTPHLRSVAGGAGDNLGKGLHGIRAGLNAGTQAAGIAARKLAEAAPAAVIGSKSGDAPESQLEKLLAEEAASASTPPTGKARAAAALPLFADPDAVQPPAKSKGRRAPDPVIAPEKHAEAPFPQIAADAHMQENGPVSAISVSAISRRLPEPGPWLRHRGTWALGAIALVSSSFAAGMLWTGGPLNRAATESVVREYLLSHPEIIPQAMQQLQSNQAAAAITQLGARITRPFSGAWAGAADGDVTLSVFTDYNCTFCRASTPDIERLLREDKRLKIVFRELPILSPDSEVAARLALVAARQGKYMPMHRALFASGNPDAAARAAAASQLGIPADAATLNDPAITREINANLDTARTLGFDGTPSWVVGTRVLKGAVGYDQLRAAIAAARRE